MEKLADISPSRSKTSSLPSLILNYCSLQMNDINLQLQTATSDDSIACLLQIEELNAGSRFLKPQSFLKGYINSLIVTPKENHLDLEIKGFKISLKSHDRITPVCYTTDITSSIKLNNLQLIEISCSIQELAFSFSPENVSLISVIMKESSRKSSPVRNGRQHWKETATRIRSFISSRRWSMRKLAGVVILWLRYVHAWENLLSLIGSPMDIMIKRSAVKMGKNQIFSKTFMHQWEVISEIEKEIPPSAIALARRVVQCKTVKNGVLSKEELPVEYFQRIFQFLGFLWSTFCFMVYSIIHWYPNTKRVEILPPDSSPNLSYRLNLGKILITISPDNKKTRVSRLDLLSFCLILDTFILLYNENICEHHLTFSCGGFEVLSSSVEYFSKGRKKGEVVGSETVLRGKPALVFNQERVSASLPLLGSMLNQTWLDWKMSCAEIGEITDEPLKVPFILCEIKNFLTDEEHSSLSHRFTKYCLAVGQLEFFLEYSSTLSLTLLLFAIQNAFSSPAKKAKAQTSTPTFLENPPVRVLDSHTFIVDMEKEVHKVLPEKLIEVGVYVAGPQIQVSLKKGSLHEAEDDICLCFDCKNIELIVSPKLESNELQMVDLAKSDDERYKFQGQTRLDASFIIHGVHVYLDGSPELQQSQIITLKPITFQLSTVRKDTWLLGESVSAFSAVLHGNASGLSGLIFVDEMSVLVEEVNGLMLALSCAFPTTDSSSFVNSSQEMLPVSSENEMLPSPSTGTSLVILSTLYILKCTFGIQSVDIVIHKSRKVNAIENQVTISESFTSRNLSVHFLPDNGLQITLQKMDMMFSYKKNERRVEGLADFIGLRAVIFRYNGLPRFEDICELSVSSCTLNSSLTNLPHISSLSHRAAASSQEEIVIPVSNTRLHAEISSTEIYLAGCHLKDVIVGKHESSKLEISLSVEGVGQRSISCHCQVPFS